MADLQNYLFRVYNKFPILSLDDKSELKESVELLNKYKLNDLIKLLIFGRIGNNNYYISSDARLAFLSLLYNKDNNSISPLAASLISDMPDSRVFRVDLGYLMLGKTNKQEYSVSFDTFMWILIFYSSKHYRDIKQNLITAIRTLITYCNKEEGSVMLERFPRLRRDLGTLEKLLEVAGSSNHTITPSIFANVINSIGGELLSYVETNGDKILDEYKIEVASISGSSNVKSSALEDILNAMFMIFKAGYYPASIASVLPDTIFATIDVDSANNISGLADYLLPLNGRGDFVGGNITKQSQQSDTGGGNVVRIVLRGAYATTCILNESYELWSPIEKRLPGSWKLFKIIYNRLKNGEYDTEDFKFSTYSFPTLHKSDATNEEIEELKEIARVSWLTLFSSFIMGHVLNLIGRRNVKHLYKVAAPVVRLSQDNIYLVPEKLHDLKNVVVSYSLEGQTELRPTFKGNWLEYVADDYYTSASNNPTGGVGYNSKYSIIITDQDEKIPKEITISASDSNQSRWQEVVEGKVVTSNNKINALELVFYDDEGNPVNIATVSASNNSSDGIEPNKLIIEETKKDVTQDY